MTDLFGGWSLPAGCSVLPGELDCSEPQPRCQHCGQFVSKEPVRAASEEVRGPDGEHLDTVVRAIHLCKSCGREVEIIK